MRPSNAGLWNLLITLFSTLLLPSMAFCPMPLAFADNRPAVSGPSRLQHQLADLQRAVAALQETVKQQSRDLAALKRENEGLKQLVAENASPSKLEMGSVSAGSMSGGTPTEPLGAPSVPGSPAGSGAYLPDIGVVADVTGMLSGKDDDTEGNDRVSVRELEVVMGHDVDPYARLDATFAFSDEESPSLEEAYATLFSLPVDLLARFGKFRPAIGKAASSHRDSLDTVDQPLVVQRYFGLEGFSKAGADLSKYLPWSSASFTEQLSLGVLEGGADEDGSIFGEVRRHPTLYGHLSNFLDISETENLELGGTYLIGSGGESEEFDVQAIGLDFTWNKYITPRNKLKLQSEAYFQNRERTHGEADDGPFTFRSNPSGLYALVDYRLSERFGLGTRYDWVELVSIMVDADRAYEQAVSGYLTFYQSEFSRWRLQYQYIWETDDEDNRIWLQGIFAIGTHKHSIK